MNNWYLPSRRSQSEQLFTIPILCPCRKPTAVWGDQEWKRISPAQVKGDEAVMYYNLNDKCGFVDEPFTSRMNFWDTLPLNENDNELLSSQNIHQRFPGGDDDIFNRFT